MVAAPWPAPGYVEVLTYPFVGRDGARRSSGCAADDPRRNALRLANPLSDEEPLMRTTLLLEPAGGAAAQRRPRQRDVAVFEIGLVTRPELPLRAAPVPGGRRTRPDDETLQQLLDARCPHQPRRVALCPGRRRASRAGWWGPGRAGRLGRRGRGRARRRRRRWPSSCVVSADEHAPWHPGRCAAARPGGRARSSGTPASCTPRSSRRSGLPERTCAAELDLDVLSSGQRHGRARTALVSDLPGRPQDVALVVDADVPAAAVEAALREGAGELLESVRLFDVYTGDQVGRPARSLAFALRFRAPDRTLTTEEVNALRDRAIARPRPPRAPSSAGPEVSGVAVVTGASRGIGRSMASALAAAGYAVAAVARDTGALATLERDVTAAGGRVLVQRAEVTDPADVDDCVGAVLEAFGRVDVLVNCAGVIETETPLWEADVEQWWRTVTVNVRGPFLMSRAVVPHMIAGGGGRVVNLASGAGDPRARWPHGVLREQVGPHPADRRPARGRLGARHPCVRPVARCRAHGDDREHAGARRPHRVDRPRAGDRPAAGAVLGRARRVVRTLCPGRRRHPRLAAGAGRPRGRPRRPRPPAPPCGVRTTRWADPVLHRN